MIDMKLIWLTLFVFCVPCGHVSGLKILLYQIAFSNTHMPFSGAIADALIDRGHVVDKIVMGYHNGVKSNGTNRLRNVYRIELVGDNRFMRSDHLVDPFAVVRFDKNDDLIKTRLDFCKQIMEDTELIDKLKTERYDIYLTTPFDICSFGLNYILQIPSTNVYSVIAQEVLISSKLGLQLLPSYVPQIFNAVVQQKNKDFWQRLQSFLYLIDVTFDELGMGVDEYAYLQKKIPNFPSITELFKQIHYIFLNTKEVLDTPQPVSSRIKFIGGIAMKSNDEKISPELEQILSTSNNRAIVFSFGSLIQTTSAPLQTKLDLLDAFKQFPDYSFIWKIHEDDKVRPYLQNYANVHPISWLPQIPLLNDDRVRVFITHMGQNSYIEASYAGKPLIGIPFFVDQFYNMGCALRKGFALYVDKHNLTTSSMVDALSRILSDEKYEKNARRLASILRDHPVSARDELIRYVEYSAKHPQLHDFMQLEAADMHVLKLYSIDVIGFLCLSALVAILLGIVVFKLLIRLIFIGREKSKRE